MHSKSARGYGRVLLLLCCALVLGMGGLSPVAGQATLDDVVSELASLRDSVELLDYNVAVIGNDLNYALYNLTEVTYGAHVAELAAMGEIASSSDAMEESLAAMRLETDYQTLQLNDIKFHAENIKDAVVEGNGYLSDIAFNVDELNSVNLLEHDAGRQAKRVTIDNWDQFPGYGGGGGGPLSVAVVGGTNQVDFGGLGEEPDVDDPEDVISGHAVGNPSQGGIEIDNSPWLGSLTDEALSSVKSQLGLWNPGDMSLGNPEKANDAFHAEGGAFRHGSFTGTTAPYAGRLPVESAPDIVVGGSGSFPSVAVGMVGSLPISDWPEVEAHAGDVKSLLKAAIDPMITGMRSDATEVQALSSTYFEVTQWEPYQGMTGSYSLAAGVAPELATHCSDQRTVMHAVSWFAALSLGAFQVLSWRFGKAGVNINQNSTFFDDVDGDGSLSDYH